jgi:choice-of-anchor B domain-containing protein
VRHLSIVVALFAVVVQLGSGQSPAPPEPPLAGHCECSNGVCPLKPGGRACSCGCEVLADRQPVQSLKALAAEECRNGSAMGFPCRDVDLLSFLPLADIGGGSGNDVWGWTDPESGREYAIVGRSTGTAFVDITDPARARFAGNLPTQTVDSLWRDVEVFANHAFIVSEAANHGMQVFDLRRLRSVGDVPATFEATAHYAGFGSAHTVAVDVRAGFAYAAGTRTCAGGLHAVDIQDPLNPQTAGCFAADGYTHDAQCIVYDGPDAAHTGREICFGSNEDTLTIVDVSEKHAQRMISRTGYDASSYTHQGWLTPDRRFFLVDDEGDERAFRTRTRTFVWDVSDLDAPFIAHVYEGPVSSIDHQLFIRGDLAYEANYRSGLRVLALGDLGAAPPHEVGFFDIYPQDDAPEFNAAWSVFPFFASGTVVVNGIEQGLFVLRPRRAAAGIPPGLSVSLVATGRPAFVNQELVYVARVVNNGPNRAASATLTIQPPAGVPIVAATSSYGACTISSIVTCSLDSLAAGSEAVVTMTVRPPATGDLVVTARAGADATIALTNVEAPRREMSLMYPIGGETIRLGRAAAVQFTMRGVEGGVRIELSRDSGRTWTTLAANAPNTGFYDWVPSGIVALVARIRVTSNVDSRLTATSAGTFEIR